MIHVSFRGCSYDVDLKGRSMEAVAREWELLDRLAKYFDAGSDRRDERYAGRRPQVDLALRASGRRDD